MQKQRWRVFSFRVVLTWDLRILQAVFLLFVAVCAVLFGVHEECLEACLYGCVVLLNFVKSLQLLHLQEIAASLTVKCTRQVHSYLGMPNGAFECSLEYRCCVFEEGAGVGAWRHWCCLSQSKIVVLNLVMEILIVKSLSCWDFFVWLGMLKASSLPGSCFVLQLPFSFWSGAGMATGWMNALRIAVEDALRSWSSCVTWLSIVCASQIGAF